MLCSKFIQTIVVLTTILVNTSKTTLSLKTTKDNETEYVVLILSGISNNERRMNVRSTWLNLVQNLNKKNGKIKYSWNLQDKKAANTNSFIKTYFVIGTKYLSNEKLSRLEKENKWYNDLLLLDKAEDTYDSLSIKMLHAIQWFSEKFTNLLYLVKTDDDSFVRIDKIVAELDAYAPDMDAEELKPFVSRSITDSNDVIKGFYWGTFMKYKTVYPYGKYREKNWFLSDTYLPYASGAGYVICRNVVDYIALNMDILHPYHAEDVSMGVYTAPLHIQRVHDIRFDPSYIARSCQNNLLVMNLHVNTKKYMFRHYIILKTTKGERLCLKERFYNDTFKYNWTVVSSKCCA